LLDAFGLFDGDEGKQLKTNMKIINNIRNYYAHNIDVSLGEEIPLNVKKLIDSMSKFFEKAIN